MPCITEGPSQYEIDSGHLNMLLDEVLGEAPGKRNDRSLNAWARHTNQRPNWSNNRKARELCKWCRHNDISKTSLDVQIWWRDHQRADKRRHAESKRRADVLRLRRSALKKLTPLERAAVLAR